MKSLRCFQVTSLFAMLLVLVAMAASGCSDTPDRSLFINAYTPVNQGKKGTIQSLELVDNYQVGIFQKLGEDFVPVFGPVQLTDGSLSLGKNAVSYSEGELVFLIEGYAQSDLISGKTTLGWQCPDGVTPQLQQEMDDDDRIRWRFNPGTCSQSPTCQAGATDEEESTQEAVAAKDVLVRGVSAPFRFTGDDAVEVDVMLARTNWFAEIPKAGSSEEALELENPRHGHAVVQIPGGKLLVVGGVFGRVQSGQGQFKMVSQVERVDIFKRKTETLDTPINRAFFSMTRYEEDFSLEIDQATGLNITPEVVRFLVVGGLTQVTASTTDPMIGGTYSNEVTLVTYDVERDTLTTENIGSGLGEGIVNHAATYLGEGYVLITGGRTQAGTPTDAAYLVSMEDKSITPMVPMNVARYGHTATAIGDTVIVFGGYGDRVVNGQAITMSSMEVWKPGEDRNLAAGTFELSWDESRVGSLDVSSDTDVVVEGSATDITTFWADTRRAEHVAFAVLDSNDTDNNRVVILGGIRVQTADGSDNDVSLLVANSSELPAIFIDPKGGVQADTEDGNPIISYIAKRQRQVNRSYYKSAWAQLAGNDDAIFAVGGIGADAGGAPSGDSIRDASMILFSGDAFGKISVSASDVTDTPMSPNPLFFDSIQSTYEMLVCGSDGAVASSLELKMVDPEDETASQQKRPLGIDPSSFQQGMVRIRSDHTLTALEDGTYLVVGGFSKASTGDSNQGQSIGTFELFMPPSVNTPGGGFQMIPEL